MSSLEDKYHQTYAILDHLKEKHQANTHIAREELRELISKKNVTYRLDANEANESGFLSALTWIWWKVAQSV